MNSGVVPEDWKAACIVPVYRGKGYRRDCNYRGIGILSIPGKIYGRILIDRVKESTKKQVEEEQGGFRSGRGCIDQIFVLKQLVEKYREKRKELYVAFMKLEKAYDKVCKEELWRVLRECGVDVHLIRSMSSLYTVSRACVVLGSRVGEMFEVRRWLRQGCVMSTWLFNIFFDKVVRQVNEKAMGKGVKLKDENGVWLKN